MSRLLVIDDDIEFCEILADYLQPEGFELTSVNDGKEGLDRALAPDSDYDLIMLDLMLPSMSGFEVLQSIRARLDTPVIMLTARTEELDRIIGLEIGADDFLIKPLNPRELVARVRAILRRTKNRSRDVSDPSAPERIAVGDIVLDTGSRVVRRDGEQLELTSVEFSFLEMLLKAAGNIVTREELAVSILGRTLNAYDRSLDIHLSHLRKKLGHRSHGIDRIKTVRGVGYVYAKPSREDLPGDALLNEGPRNAGFVSKKKFHLVS